MPFVYKSELDLYKEGNKISIPIKNEKRSLILPKSFKSKEIASAKYEDSSLNINFQ